MIVGTTSGSGKKADPPSGQNAAAQVDAANITFTAPTRVGKGIIDFVITVNPGGTTQTVNFTSAGAAMSKSFTGLSSSNSYNFTIVARGTNGVNSDATPSTNTVTPLPPSFGPYFPPYFPPHFPPPYFPPSFGPYFPPHFPPPCFSPFPSSVPPDSPWVLVSAGVRLDKCTGGSPCCEIYCKFSVWDIYSSSDGCHAYGLFQYCEC